MSAGLMTVGATTAERAWSSYAQSMQELVAIERDPSSTYMRRADAALAAHQRWRVFQAAFERIAS